MTDCLDAEHNSGCFAARFSLPQSLDALNALYWPVVRYEFDVRNCEDCDVFKAKRQRDPETRS